MESEALGDGGTSGARNELMANRARKSIACLVARKPIKMSPNSQLELQTAALLTGEAQKQIGCCCFPRLHSRRHERLDADFELMELKRRFNLVGSSRRSPLGDARRHPVAVYSKRSAPSRETERPAPRAPRLQLERRLAWYWH